MVPMSAFGILVLTARKKLDEILNVNGCDYLNQKGSFRLQTAIEYNQRRVALWNY